MTFWFDLKHIQNSYILFNLIEGSRFDRGVADEVEGALQVEAELSAGHQGPVHHHGQVLGNYGDYVVTGMFLAIMVIVFM